MGKQVVFGHGTNPSRCNHTVYLRWGVDSENGYLPVFTKFGWCVGVNLDLLVDFGPCCKESSIVQNVLWAFRLDQG